MGYADFCRIVSKVYISHNSIFGVTGPKFTQCRRIIGAIKMLIDIVIFQSVLKYQGAEWRSVCQFCKLSHFFTAILFDCIWWLLSTVCESKLVAMVEIYNTNASTFHLVEKIWKSVQLMLKYLWSVKKKKLWKVTLKYIAWSASLPSGIKYLQCAQKLTMGAFFYCVRALWPI